MVKVTRKFCWFMVGQDEVLVKIADALLKSAIPLSAAPAHGKSLGNQTYND
jgi:hypothetical protein